MDAKRDSVYTSEIIIVMVNVFPPIKNQISEKNFPTGFISTRSPSFIIYVYDDHCESP